MSSPRSLLDALAMLVLAAAYLVPDHYPPWSSYYNESAAALSLCLLVMGRGRHWWTGRIGVTALVLLLVCAVPVAQWIAGQLRYSGDAWISALYVGGLAVAIATGQVWAREPGARPVQWLAGALLFAGAVSSVIALLQGLGLDVLDGYNYPVDASAHATANIGQANNLATLLGLAALGVFALFETRRLSAVMALPLLLLLMVGAAATQSRTALLFGPLAVAGVWWARRKGIAVRTSIAVIGVVFAVQVAFAICWPSVQQHLLIASPPSLGERSLGTGRFAAWQLFIDALGRSPWSGYGWLQVGPAQLSVAEQHAPISNKIWFQAHNLFLDILLWCGYPLGALLCALLVWWFASRWRRVHSLDGLIALLAISMVGAHAMLELPHHYAYFLVPVGLWAGIAEEGTGRPRVRACWMLAPIAIALLATIEIWREYPAIEDDFRLVRYELMHIGTVHATEPAPSAPMMSSVTAFLRTARMDPAQRMSPEALDEIRASAERYAYAASLFRYAQALAANGRMDDAVRVFHLIGRVHGERSEALYRQALREAAEADRAGLRDLSARVAPLPVAQTTSSPAQAQSPPP